MAMPNLQRDIIANVVSNMDAAERRKIQEALASGMTVAEYKIIFLTEFENPANATKTQPIRLLIQLGLDIDAVAEGIWNAMKGASVQ